MSPTAPRAGKYRIPTVALLGLLISATPMIWYPKYVLLGFFAILGQGTGTWGILLLGYPVLLVGAAVLARSFSTEVFISTMVAFFPILILIGSILVAGEPLSFFFKY